MKSLIGANVLIFIGVFIIGLIAGVGVIQVLGILLILAGGIITGQLDEQKKEYFD